MSCSGCGLHPVWGQIDRPVWEPLLEAVGERLTGTFMWMQQLNLEDGSKVHAYKHSFTRRYLYLSEDGRAYQEAPCETFVEDRLDFALEAALCNWWILAGWEDEDATAIRDAILKANESSAKTSILDLRDKLRCGRGAATPP